MDNTIDLREWLEGWPYDPEDNVRRVRGKDGREILQVRVPLGIEQYELDGRPDGQRPHSKESELEYQLERLEKARAAGKEASFTLSQDACAELFDEGMLYYYRYLHCFQIKDWKRTVRDTVRNLRLFDLVHRYAEREDDQLYLEQWRPYIVRMHAAAGAMLELEQDHYAKALEIINAAIATIEGLSDLDDETFQFERKRSLVALREMAEQIEQVKPRSELERLEHELHEAIEVQAFERAAQLRDRIRALRRRP